MNLHRTRRAYSAFPTAAVSARVPAVVPARAAAVLIPRQYPAVPLPAKDTVLTHAGGYTHYEVALPQIDITGDGNAEILVAPPSAAAVNVARATFTNSTPNIVMLEVGDGLEAYVPAAGVVTLVNNGTAWELDPATPATIVVT